MTRRQFWGTVAAMVVLFLLIAGPVWRNPWDVDVAIVASYIPIPPVVALLLWRNGQLKRRTWLVNTVGVICAKFMITAAILVVIWSVSKGPPKPGAAFAPTSSAMKATAARTTSKEAVLELGNGGQGFEPTSATVRRGDRIALRSTDQQLHTVKAVWKDGTWLRNIPVLGSGAPAFLEVVGGGSELSLSCTVHPNEHVARLTVEPAATSR